jgi:hypothetical protein
MTLLTNRHSPHVGQGHRHFLAILFLSVAFVRACQRSGNRYRSLAESYDSSRTASVGTSCRSFRCRHESGASLILISQTTGELPRRDIAIAMACFRNHYSVSPPRRSNLHWLCGTAINPKVSYDQTRRFPCSALDSAGFSALASFDAHDSLQDYETVLVGPGARIDL